ncbi:hypothetical protein ACFSL6_23945 [Paenibacillus thailandensis]|uniref:hypothetical protein n=1 Tax=Paenibacillus thailandensis TaxID=393250 RepID=UPI00363ED207
MQLDRILQLREEKAQLYEAVRVRGRHALSDRAKYAAIARVGEIDREIADTERGGPEEPPKHPLDGLTIDELRALYDEKLAAYKESDGRDARQQAELLTINTRIERMKAEVTTNVEN